MTAKPAEAGDPFEAGLDDVELLAEAGDVEGLLAVAKAARRADLPLAKAAWGAAAELGSTEAHYALALVRLQEGDEAGGKTALRAAADGGLVLAQIHLGNLYATGNVYPADSEKAANWYRMAARGAGVDPASDDGRRQLAELGALRVIEALADEGRLSADDRERLLRKARLHGARPTAATPPPPAVPAPPAKAIAPQEPAPEADDGAAPTATVPRAEASPSPTPKPKTAAPTPKPKAEPRRPKGHGTPADGLAATGWTLLFAAAGIGGGFAARAGLVEAFAGRPMPVFGTHAEYIFPSVALTLTVLPSLLFFRAPTVLKAALVAAVVFGAGLEAVAGKFTALPGDVVPAVLAVVAFLGAAAVFGLFGGAKPRPKGPVAL